MSRTRRVQAVVWGILAIGVATPQSGADEVLPAVASIEPKFSVGALGRLEPKDGLVRLAGPSETGAVVRELLVDEGDRVEKGQVVALLDRVELYEARVERARAELAYASAELARRLILHEGKHISDSEMEDWELRVRVAKADLRLARADLDLARVRAPIDGQVIAVHARDGEKVGPEGILELGRTDEMYAIAEVYETDVGKVRLGQRATIASPALPEPLHGTVDRIGLKVGKLDLVATDPAARTDARVVEVEVRLDEGGVATALTNLQVEIRFEP
jgi:HlyD family secretion protein